MLLTSRDRKAVLVFPLLLFLFGGGLLAGALGAFGYGQEWGAVIGMGLIGGFCLWIALAELTTLRSDARTLRLWGPFRRRRLQAEPCAFGVRLKAGSRSTAFVVFATDGEASVDVGEWQTERGARRGIERLCDALYGSSSRSGGARAQREVEQVERVWKASAAEAQKTVDAYYRSKRHRVSKYAIIGLVVSYSIGMLLYQYFTGQL